jgi:NADH:ubiquinone oxidoreductase subunit H
MTIIYYIIYSLIIIVPILISVAYLTLLERKILGYSQLRKGPNVVGIYGILQPLADGVKLFSKEIVIPSHANIFLFSFAPIFALLMGLIPWFLFPWGNYNYGILVQHSYSLLILLAILSIGIFAVLLSGWSSSSKYAFLGSIRAVAQMISYEVSLSIILMGIIITTGSLNLSFINFIQSKISFLLISLWPFAFLYIVSMLAETNRAPFDLSEGESELVSGYNVEYSAMPFALFFLAEYSHIIFSSFLFAILFMGSNHYFFFYNIPIIGILVSSFSLCMKGTFISFCFLWVRTSFPRIRYDQLMDMLWKNYLPLSISLLWFINCIIIGFNIGITSGLN